MKNWTECSLEKHRFPIKFVIFFVSYVCFIVRVTVEDKNKAVICYLLAPIGHNVIRKKEKKA